MEGREPISIDGNLFALDLEFVRGAEARGLFESLQMHPLWKGRLGGPPIPGFVTYPNYPEKEVSWTTRLIGLRHYHDEIYWTWLMGLSLKIALRFDADYYPQVAWRSRSFHVRAISLNRFQPRQM